MENLEDRIKKTNSFEDLIVWQKAHQFTLEVYSISKSFPKEELFGLTSQFRRASVSISANIAEGYKKFGYKDKIRFFNISQGSLEECKYYLILCKDLKYIDLERFNLLKNISNEVGKMLNVYISKVNSSNS